MSLILVKYGQAISRKRLLVVKLDNLEIQNCCLDDEWTQIL